MNTQTPSASLQEQQTIKHIHYYLFLEMLSWRLDWKMCRTDGANESTIHIFSPVRWKSPTF